MFSRLLVAGLLVAIALDSIGQQHREKEDRLFSLTWAAHQKDVKAIEALIAADKEIVKVKNSLGETALHHPDVLAQPEIIELLVKAGADVDQRDNEGNTPLHGAAQRGNLRAAEALIALGADPHARHLPLRSGYEGHSVLDLAAGFGGSEDLVKLLLKRGCKVIELKGNNSRSAIHFACVGFCRRGKRSNGDIIDLLVKEVKDINVRNDLRETPLLVAAEHLAVETIEHLLKNYKELDLNAQDFKGDTALHLAADYHTKRQGELCAAVIRLLLKHGAKTTITNRKGQTALDVAKASKEQVVMRAFEQKEDQ
jgi:ankyrin repeat protein